MTGTEQGSVEYDRHRTHYNHPLQWLNWKIWHFNLHRTRNIKWQHVQNQEGNWACSTLSSLSTVEQMVRNLSSGTPHTANIPSRMRLSLTWNGDMVTEAHQVSSAHVGTSWSSDDRPWSGSHQGPAHWGFHGRSSDTQHQVSWRRTAPRYRNPETHKFIQGPD